MGRVGAGPQPSRKACLQVSERVYLGLGSNLGDRQGNIRTALELLGNSIAVIKTSSVYETEPWGYEEQPRFLNCVCEGTTRLVPRALLTAAKEVEMAVGREPTFPNGPRLLDVDILLYGHQVVREPGLEIPHPRMWERAFVLVPLAEIAEAYLHPVLGQTVGQLLHSLASIQGSEDGLPEGVKWWSAPASLLPVS